MKLLASVGNTKVDKSQKASEGTLFRSLSMMPTASLCPASKAAGCFEGCLKSAGRGSFSNVSESRQKKTIFWETDQQGFLRQLRQELSNFSRLCQRKGVKGIVRLNVLSDIPWEDYGIPQAFPELSFYDYTKLGRRLHKELPENYQLIFSYSGKASYRNQVALGETSSRPMAVVFSGSFPKFFRGRPVVDGDANDWYNVNQGPVVVALKAKGKAKKDTSGFVVHSSEDTLAIA